MRRFLVQVRLLAGRLLMGFFEVLTFLQVRLLVEISLIVSFERFDGFFFERLRVRF